MNTLDKISLGVYVALVLFVIYASWSDPRMWNQVVMGMVVSAGLVLVIAVICLVGALWETRGGR